jgi:hypothetical protein
MRRSGRKLAPILIRKLIASSDEKCKTREQALLAEIHRGRRHVTPMDWQLPELG